MQKFRLANGGSIDRQQELRFHFNGTRFTGYLGDTLASALLANGVGMVSRSIKYHRPRGIMGIGPEEPNALLQIGEGAQTLPNQKATQVELYEGLVANTVNCWPSLETDALSFINGMMARFLTPGFYYKTFKWPARFWRPYEHLLRSASGSGYAPAQPDPDRYDKANTHCDVAIVGGGPAGMAAALESGRAGARVILIDDQSDLGGMLLNGEGDSYGEPLRSWWASTAAEVRDMPNVRCLRRTTVFGYYNHNFLGAIERVSDHLAPRAGGVLRQRLWHIRAKQVVIATGAFERPLVFHDNDRPGIMLASAVRGYIKRYGVMPGRRAVVFTNNDSAYSTALAIAETGAHVTLLDVRPSVSGHATHQLHEKGIEVLEGCVITGTSGQTAIDGIEVAAVSPKPHDVSIWDESIKDKGRLQCDLLAVSGGWTPALDMYCQSGGKAIYDAARVCFVPGPSVQQERSAGACQGTFRVSGCIAEGARAGASAAYQAGFGNGQPTGPVLSLSESADRPSKPTWLVSSRFPLGRGSKQFVDFQNDTSAADIFQAAHENFQSIEHIKRYTLLGFGTDQGKLSNVNGIGILSLILKKDMNAIGTTTFRPGYTPVTFGALAGRDIGALADPVRKTAIHEWHEKAGAVFENVGQWKRPHYYPKPGESMQDAVHRECLATQSSIGVLDASTLGKIDVQGPDAAEFLNRLYTNEKERLAPGRCHYSLMLGEDGMVFDDGITARLSENHFWLTTTTSGAGRVMAWMERWLQTEWPTLRVYLTSVTDHFAAISINGPHSRSLLVELSEGVDFSPQAFPFMSFREGKLCGVSARFFRISFSGELAYEVYIPANVAMTIWDQVFRAGRKYDITPYGTETMHVLRADKGYIIVGQDTDGSLTPRDLGMNWIVSTKKDFIGLRSLSRSDTARGNRKQLVGLLTEDPKTVLPEGGQITANRSFAIPVPMLGHVTSSYMSPRVGRSIALAVIKGGHQSLGNTVYVSGTGGPAIPAKVVSPVFYDPEGKLQNV